MVKLYYNSIILSIVYTIFNFCANLILSCSCFLSIIANGKLVFPCKFLCFVITHDFALILLNNACYSTHINPYFVIAFFAAQMFACFEYSHLDKCLAIMGADLLSSFEPAPLSALILFILFTAFINLIMVSATSKWAFMSFIFIPMFAQMGISPDVTQCAFRIGDSSTNAITPFLFYMPLVLTYMRQYDKQITYGSLLKYTWRYSLCILAAWTLLFIVWYLLKIPMGL